MEVVRLIVDGADTVEGNADHGEGHYDGRGPIDAVALEFLFCYMAGCFGEKEEGHIGEEGEEEARGNVMEDADEIVFLVRGRSGQQCNANCKEAGEFTDDGILLCIAVVAQHEDANRYKDAFELIAHARVVVGAHRGEYAEVIQDERSQHHDGHQADAEDADPFAQGHEGDDPGLRTRVGFDLGLVGGRTCHNVGVDCLGIYFCWWIAEQVKEVGCGPAGGLAGVVDHGLDELREGLAVID